MGGITKGYETYRMRDMFTILTVVIVSIYQTVSTYTVQICVVYCVSIIPQ